MKLGEANHVLALYKVWVSAKKSERRPLVFPTAKLVEAIGVVNGFLKVFQSVPPSPPMLEAMGHVVALEAGEWWPALDSFTQQTVNNTNSKAFVAAMDVACGITREKSKDDLARELVAEMAAKIKVQEEQSEHQEKGPVEVGSADSEAESTGIDPPADITTGGDGSEQRVTDPQ